MKVIWHGKRENVTVQLRRDSEGITVYASACHPREGYGWLFLTPEQALELAEMLDEALCQGEVTGSDRRTDTE